MTLTMFEFQCVFVEYLVQGGARWICQYSLGTSFLG